VQTNLFYEKSEIIENLQIWISTMSSASNRPFRHTSTVVSLAVISALSGVARDIVEQTAKKNRQSETESKKARVNKARVSGVNKEIGELSQKLEKVDHAIGDWFDTVFVHRYRDVDPKIRVECVEALAEWTIIYPDKFFDGAHLRYLGWVLSDPHPPTRVEVLKQLQNLFRDKDKLPGLKTFTERFRPRMVEMATHDAETNVRAAAVELLDILRDAGFLEPNDIDSVGRLVFDTEPKVRKAVIGFFAENITMAYEAQIDDMGGQEALDEALAPADDEDEFTNPTLGWLKLKCLAEQLITYDSDDTELPSQLERLAPSGIELGLIAAGIESRFYLAASVLYDALPEIQAWDVLAGYLLHDHSQTAQNGAGEDNVAMLKENCRLSDREEIVLLDVLNASVKQRLLRLAEAQKDKKKTRAQRTADKEELSDTIRRLSTFIPQLLNKFGAVPEAASLCLRLERTLNLDVFQELRQNTALTSLLDDVNKQFLTHHNEQVLDEAIESILHALTHEDSKEVIESKVQGLWDDLVNTFDVLRRGRDLSKAGNLAGNVLSGVSNIVLKMSKLAKVSEPVVLDKIAPAPKSKSKKEVALTTPPVSSLLHIIERGVATDNLDAEVAAAEAALVRHALNAMLMYFVWKFRHCASCIESNTRIEDDDLSAIAERQDVCLQALVNIMESRKGADDIRLEAAYLLLDIHNLFYSLKTVHARAKAAKPQQRNAANEPNDDWERALCHPIEANTKKILLQILNAAEATLAKRTQKHLEEPGIDDDPIDPDDDPQSSEDEEEEEDERVAEEKKYRTLLTEGRLCFLGSRMVNAVQVGTLGADVRKRLEKNKTKLGHDWKEVVAHLDIVKNLKSKGGKKAAPKPAPARANTNSKSKEFVDDGSDDEEQEEQQHEDEEMADADDEPANEDEHVNGDADAEENGAVEGSPEAESVLGD
jgi:cohesin complex subunit SA-1/2